MKPIYYFSNLYLSSYWQEYSSLTGTSWVVLFNPGAESFYIWDGNFHHHSDGPGCQPRGYYSEVQTFFEFFDQ